MLCTLSLGSFATFSKTPNWFLHAYAGLNEVKDVGSFDRRLSSLCGSIDGLEQRLAQAESAASVAEEKAQHYAIRCTSSSDKKILA